MRCTRHIWKRHAGELFAVPLRNRAWAPGQPGCLLVSSAMHGSHAHRMAAANLAVDCYACHPGIRTQCQRDIHLARHDLQLLSRSMAAVAATRLRDGPGWMNRVVAVVTSSGNRSSTSSRGRAVPRCGRARRRQMRECHNSPHATTPTVTSVDNLQAAAGRGTSAPSTRAGLSHHTPGPVRAQA